MAKTVKEKFAKGMEIGGNAMKIIGELTVPMMTCGVIRAVLPPGVSLIIQGGCLLGGLMLGGMVNRHLDRHIDETISETLKDMDETLTEIDKSIAVIKAENFEDAIKELEENEDEGA